MGNSPSRRSSFTRELEKFANPTGLYPTCAWDVRMVRRMVVEKKIAPRFSGRDSIESCFTQECPICFMFYPGALNSVTCCGKMICTECFLQLKPPTKQVHCPYCNHKALSIKYTEPHDLNLTVIHAATSYKNPPASEENEDKEEQSIAIHFASAADRQRIRDDLRSQLNLSERPLASVATLPVPMMLSSSQSFPRHHLSQQQMSRFQTPQRNSFNYIIDTTEETPSIAHDPRYIIASAADAARLEEMMVMEAIRRSMRDLTVDESSPATQRSLETLSLSPQRRPSTTTSYDATISPYSAPSTTATSSVSH